MALGIVKPNLKLGVFVTLVAFAISSIYPTATKFAYADGANTIFVLWISMFIRTIVLMCACAVTRRPIFDSRAYQKVSCLAGGLQALSAAGVIIALAFLPVALVGTVAATHTLVLLLFMGARGEASFSPMTLVITLSALVGLTFVLDVWHQQPVANWIGIALSIMASVTAAARVYIFGKQMSARNPAVVGAESSLFASLFVLLLAFWQVPVVPETINGLGWSLLCGLAIGLGAIGMFFGIALLGSFRWSLLSKVEPIFMALYAVVLMDEYLNPSQYFGVSVVIASLVAYQIFSHRKEQKLKAIESEA